MANRNQPDLFNGLQKMLLRQDKGAVTDGKLLASFIERGDEDAIAAIVRRHGPMVWGVCRRILNNVHDAEDAFQATFLVLVRKAESIIPREMVGNWLYGVAYQIAVKARNMATTRMVREKQVDSLPEPQAVEEDHWSQIQPAIDRELSGLPEKYRAAIVMCDIEGKTRKVAAGQLGVPEGTLAARLARGRALLAKRLRKHGILLSACSLGVLLWQLAAAASVPPMVFASTVKAAGMLAAGHPLAAATSATSAKLTRGFCYSIFLVKLKAIAVAVVAFTVIGAACWFGIDSQARSVELGNAANWTRQHSSDDRSRLNTGAANQPIGDARMAAMASALKIEPPLLLFSHDESGRTQIYSMRPDGTGVKRITDHDSNNRFAVWSPDGARIAFASDRDGKSQIFTMDADGSNVTQLTKRNEDCNNPAWSPDGKKIAYTKIIPCSFPNVFVMDWDGKAQTNLSNSASHDSDPAWSPDGKKIAFASTRLHSGFRLFVMDADGSNIVALTEKDNAVGFVFPAWSPDGKKIAYGDNVNGDIEVFVSDADGRKRKQLTHLKGKSGFPAWSPDGKRITFSQVIAGVASIRVIDADGDNQQVLVEKANSQGKSNHLSWRK